MMKCRTKNAFSILATAAVAFTLTSAAYAGEVKKRIRPTPPTLIAGHVNQDEVPVPPWSHVNQDDMGGPPGGRGQSPPSGQGWTPPQWMPFPFNVFRIYFFSPVPPAQPKTLVK